MLAARILNRFYFIQSGPYKPPVQSYSIIARFAAVLAIWLLASSALASQPSGFNIPGQSLTEALIEFAEQTGLQLVYPAQLTAGIKTGGAKGNTPEELLDELLEGTNLKIEYLNVNTITLKKMEQLSGEIRMSKESKGRRMDSNKKKSIFGRLSAAIAAVVLSGGATGAEAVDTPANKRSSAAIEEIVVTATRRETTLQDSAISVSALSGDQLEDLGLYAVADALSLIPGVASITNQPGLNEITIRGVNTVLYATTDANGVENPVSAAYLDQVPVSSVIAKMPDFRLVDMARVEVLKGPQGTLFGQSAMGGAVRYITNKPNTEGVAGGVSGYGSSTADRGGWNYGLDGYVNIPLSDSVAVRLVGYTQQNDGFIDVVGTPNIANTPTTPQSEVKRANDENTVGGRAALNWDITERTSLYLGYLYHNVDLPSNQLISGTYVPTGDPFLNGQPLNVIPVDEDRFVAMHLGPSRDDASIYTLEFNHEFDWATAAVILGRKDINGYRLFEGDESSGITEAYGNHDSKLTLESDTAEFRLVSSTGDSFIDWIVGIWYEDADGRAFSGATITGNDIFLGPFVIPEGTLAIDKMRDIVYQELAVFGELTFHFTDQLSFTAGYRRADVENNYTWQRAAGLFDIVTGDDQLVGIDQKTQEDVDTYKFNLSYNFSDDLLVYGVASSGYRPGGFNTGNPLFGIPDSEFGSDTLWNYELGLRSSWLDERLVVNGFVYRIDWSDMQVGASTSFPLFYDSTQNAGEATIDGFELETKLRATDSLTLALNYTFTDAEISKVGSAVLAGGVEATGLVRKGDRLPGTPRNSASFVANWRSPLGGGNELLANLTYRYVGDRTIAVGVDREMPSYQLIDMQVGVGLDNGATVTLFVDNVADEVAIQSVFILPLPFFEYNGVNRPRTVGLRVRYNF